MERDSHTQTVEDGGMCLLLDQASHSCPSRLAGGKGHNLWVLGSMPGCQVPDWFCITTNAFSTFIEAWLMHTHTHAHTHTQNILTAVL